MVQSSIIYGIILIVKQNLPTMPEELKKWLESIPEGYELSGFKRGEYYGEKQIKLFLRRK